MEDGYEIKQTGERGEGAFATRPFKAGETIMVGLIDKEFKENTSHTSQIAENRFVFYKGHISKVNHCCEPNCGLKANEWGAHNFVAIKDIAIGEEILFDYAMRNYTIQHFPPKCMCGSKNCRGSVTGWKDLPEERKKVYRDFAAFYLLEIDERRSHL